MSAQTRGVCTALASLGVAVLAALMLASTASARDSLFFYINNEAIRETEIEAPAGSPTGLFIFGLTLAGHGDCELTQAGGTLLVNGHSKDKVSFSKAPEGVSCSGTTVTGLITTVELMDSGKLTLKASPKLALTSPGPCTYEAKKLTFIAPLPVLSNWQNSNSPLQAALKLSPKVSAGTCAKTDNLLVERFTLFDEAVGPRVHDYQYRLYG